jgi:four helix bundle protein
MIKTYKDMIVWQKAIELVIEVYALTKKFPQEEIFGLTSQMRRASVSIPSNIAEGFTRRTRKEYAQFSRIAFGSGAELETQVIIAKRLNH